MKKHSSIRALLAASLVCGGLVATASAQDTISWETAATDLTGATGTLQMNGTAVVNIGGTDFVYIIGGNTGNDGGDTDLIRYAPVDGDDLGPWATATANLDGAGVAYHTRSCLGHNGRIYVVGGRFNSGFAIYNGIRVFEPDSTGDIPATNVTEYPGPTGAVTLDRLEMMAAIVPSQTASGQSVLFIIGGSTFGSGTAGRDAVKRVFIDDSTGEIVGADPVTGDLTPAITTLDPLPGFRGSTQAVVHDGYIYLPGGFDGAGRADTIYAEILSDDTLGTWQTATATLPQTRFDGGAASFAGNLYVMGGTVSSNADTLNTVYRAVMGANGDITAWEADAPVSALVPGFRRIGATVAEDAVYIIGGRLDGSGFSDDVQVGTEIQTSVRDWHLQ